MNRPVTYLIILFLVMSLNNLAFAGDSSPGDPSAGAVVADILALRPLGFCGLILGTAAFVISLPVSIASKKTEEVSRILLEEPYRYTFERPLGKM